MSSAMQPKGVDGASVEDNLLKRLGRWREARADALFRSWLRHPWRFSFALTIVLLVAFYAVVHFHNHIQNVATGNKLMFDQLLTVTGIMISVTFGVIGWFGSVVVEHMQSEMRNELNSLSSLNSKLAGNVTNLEEVVRLRLNGIPEILGRAIYLVDHAMDELFVVTFTVRLGAVHRIAFMGESDIGVAIPGTTERVNFEAATTRFWERIQQRVVDIRSFRLLTVEGDANSRMFAEQLPQRPGYEDLDVNRAVVDMIDSWETIQALARRRGNKVGKADLRATDTLPFQMVLARLKPEANDVKARYGCLIFLVGSGTAHVNNAAAGFYTELNDFIDIYRNVAETLFASAKSPGAVVATTVGAPAATPVR